MTLTPTPTVPIPTDPATLTQQDVRTLASTPLSATATAARTMYGGDHLGLISAAGVYPYWRGPMLTLDPGLRGEAATAQAREVKAFQDVLRRSFTSVNFVREILDREISASVARMTWAEQHSLLDQWWRQGQTRVERTLRDAITQARREGRAVLRFRLATPPPGTRGAQPAAYLRLELVPPEQARVLEHPDTLQPLGTYAYQVDGIDAAELSYLDPQGRTITRVYRDGRHTDSTPLDLGGRLPLIEITLPPLITEQVLQNQMAYNTVVTMSVRNTELAGFVERYGINIEPPFILEPDPDHPGEQRRRYLPFQTGPARLNLWRQATYDKSDADGTYTGEQPLGKGEYGRFEPTSAEPLTAAADLLRQNIYGETGQMFVLMSADASSSGRSREVAMSDFDLRREEVADAARYLISTVGETALALLAALSGTPDPRVRVTGQVRTRATPQAPDDRSADLADLQAGIMTPAEIRARRGLDETQPPPDPPPEPAPQT